MDALMIYGAYGYTGELISRTAAAREFDPVLAGRDPDRLHPLGTDLDCRSRAFGLTDDIEAHLSGVDAVLNCAGPFDATAEPLVEACLNRGVDYLDITGELPVFERLARRDGEATAAGITLMPGVGYDVVPTDSLAAHLQARLPEATHLALALSASGSLSGGTLKTLLNGVGSGSAIREDGHLRAIPTASKTRVVDFGTGTETVMTIPWGDLSTAYRTTGIPNIAVYVAVPDAVRHTLMLTRPFGGVLATEPVQRLLKGLVDRFVEGPSWAARAENETTIWGEAWSESSGETVQSILRTPDTYELTVAAALACAEGVLDGEAPDGFATPAGAFGPDLVLELPGVSRQDR
ncbi:saccharopine dehydrogenase family protein [Halohasta salina]|uniref:saccharopine dehydrogenase family protein n=1 Tax=Halohasta salina TaxID=2961621 RepID=UPI0020A5A41C|nr:saccharopine dehydrogenase NADP-binding domain-containing protein [Halohasta salina]